MKELGRIPENRLRADMKTNESVSEISKEYFYSVHISPLVANPVSIVCSLSTLIYLYVVNKRFTFWQRRLNDRLVAYLALVDLLYSSEHSVDHLFIVITKRFPPGVACELLALLLGEFVFAQGLLISLIALSAFSLIVREKHLSFGRYDWRLLLTAFGAPAVIGSLFFGLDYYGPSRVWCLVDERKSSGPIINNIYSSTMILSLSVAVFVYTSIWVKVYRTSRRLGKFASPRRGNIPIAVTPKSNTQNLRLAKVLSMLVAAYFVQWSPYVVYSLWSFAGDPHPALLVVSTICCNLGGLYNMLAYTVIRKKQQPRETSRHTGETMQTVSMNVEAEQS